MAAGDTVTIYVTVSGMSNDNAEADEEVPAYTAAPVPTAIPTAAPGSFYVSATLFSPEWTSVISDNVAIAGNGTYAVNMTASEDMDDIMLLWLDAGLLGYDNDGDIEIPSKSQDSSIPY